MFRLLTIIVLISIWIANGQQKFDSTETCITSDGGPGECRSIVSCELKLGNPTYCNRPNKLQTTVCCPKSSDYDGKHIFANGSRRRRSANRRERKLQRGNRPLKRIRERVREFVRKRGRKRKQENRNNNAGKSISAPGMNFDCGIRTEITVPSPLHFRRKRVVEALMIFPRQLGPSVVGDTYKRKSWPWMALIGRPAGNITNWFCDGTLINEQWVLTAAHCIEREVNLIIRLGEHDYSSTNDGPLPEDYHVSRKFTYPKYDPTIAYHDMALLKLEREAELSNTINPVCLPWGEQTNNNFRDQIVTLTGWGTTSFGGSRSPLLQEVDISVFGVHICAKSYSTLEDFTRLWPNGMTTGLVLCAGAETGGRDACQGDSGGPIVHKNNEIYTQIGVVSRGFGCGQAEYPGLYTPLASRIHLRWIKKKAF